MQVSAEARWFGAGAIPGGLGDWFMAPVGVFRCPPGGGGARTDTYLRLDGTELNVKQRGSKPGVEVKGLLDALPWSLQFGAVPVAPRLFCKWRGDGLGIDGRPAVEVVKTRWLRTFATTTEPREIRLGAGDSGEDPLDGGKGPAIGCHVELTALTLGDAAWWTFAAEAFAIGRPGETVALVDRALGATLRFLAPRAPVDLRGAEPRSYAEWLAAHA